MSSLINPNNDKGNQGNSINYNLSPNEYIKNKNLSDYRVIIYALTLFSQIENNLFLKDMLVFLMIKFYHIYYILQIQLKRKYLN